MLPLYDLNPHRRTPVVVVAFVAVNLAMFVAQHAQPMFTETWSLVPATLWRGPDPHAWLTIVSSMFLHADWPHLLGNGWFLWLFGNNIEDRLGPARFVLFYVLSGLVAAMAQVAVAPQSLVPMIGASGAISGILGAYLRYFPMTPVVTLVPFIVPIVPIPAFVFVVVWFVFQFTQGIGSLANAGQEGGVAWWAHIGGFLAGFWLAGRFRRRLHPAPAARRR